MHAFSAYARNVAVRILERRLVDAVATVLLPSLVVYAYDSLVALVEVSALSVIRGVDVPCVRLVWGDLEVAGDVIAWP